MELSWLEDFLTLSVTGNFSRSAEARSISQPAFSRRIRNLEYWVGTPLVDRSVFPVALTPAGEAFRKRAEETIRRLQYSREEAKGLASRTGALISFAGLHTLALSFFPRWISGLQDSIGEMQIRLVADNLSGCVEALMSGSSDLTLCYSHPSVPTALDTNLFPSIELATDRIFPVCAPDASGKPRYDLNDKKGIPYLWYAPESFLGRIVNTVVESNAMGPKLRFHYENSMAEALKNVAVEGRGLAWIPEISMRNELSSGALVPVGGKEHIKTISIRLYRSNERSRPEVEKLWRHCQANLSGK